MNAVGGYFGLELRKGEHYHKDAIRLNTARNCFEYVLRTKGYIKVYIPYYTCEVILEPIRKLGVKYEFYHINENLELTVLPKLNANEAFLYTNYFGLKQEYVKRLVSVYDKQLIVDNSQAFYAEPLKGIDTFYSARKFFGVPDGAYLYTDMPLMPSLVQDYSYERMSHLLKRIDLGAEAGYHDFRVNDDGLCGQEIKKMSKLTDSLLLGIDYEFVRDRRRKNYLLFEEVLGFTNMLHLSCDDTTVPMIYPYWVKNGFVLKKKLIDNKVFVATYWSNVRSVLQNDDVEMMLVNDMIPLPSDQRYEEKDLNRIIDMIKVDIYA